MSATVDLQTKDESQPSVSPTATTSPLDATAGAENPAIDFPIARLFEIASKYWVPLFACVYGSGYIIVSIYHGSLGLTEPGPLKPNLIAAGILFLVITGLALPVMLFLTRRLFAGQLLTEFLPARTTIRAVAYVSCWGGFQLFVWDVLVALSLQALLHPVGQQRFTSDFICTTSLGAAGFFYITGMKEAEQIKALRNPVVLFICGAMTGWLLYVSIPFDGQFGVRQFALYFLLVQILFLLIGRTLLHGPTRKRSNWPGVLGMLIIPTLVFGEFVYPHIRSEFGGGSPIVATLTVSSTSNSALQQWVTVEIVDETAEGFYCRRSETDNVRFIPRASVISIEFQKPKKIL